ncbi:MAG: phosphatidylglycerophosphatase A family protein [Gammaproteobacteria bacterium]
MPIIKPALHNLKNPVHLLALGLGAGLTPKLPGTAGTLVGVVLYLLLPDLSLVHYTGLLVVLFVPGIWICGRTARDLGVHDHPAIVYDEIVGYLVTMSLAPPGWWWIVVGFLLFRLFDIWKPWPIRWLDRSVAGGFGVMLDDLVAGLFALLALQVVVHAPYLF